MMMMIMLVQGAATRECDGERGYGDGTGDGNRRHIQIVFSQQGSKKSAGKKVNKGQAKVAIEAEQGHTPLIAQAHYRDGVYTRKEAEAREASGAHANTGGN
jgi:hypothetical protein